MKRNIFINLLSTLPFIGVLPAINKDRDFVKYLISIGATREQALRCEREWTKEGLNTDKFDFVIEWVNKCY